VTKRQRLARGSGHELRGQILRVAMDILADVGNTDALTMRAVASAAGVSAPSVYRHFPDKQSLVRELLTSGFAEFEQALRAAADDAGDNPLDRATAMARAYIQSGLGNPGTYRVLFSARNAGPAGLGLPDNVEHPGAASFKLLVEAVAACLPSARQGDAAALAVELWASLHGIVDLRITKPEMPWPDPNGDVIDHALAAVYRAAQS
jgi:AcrR family transcriptional regulator